MAWNKPHKLGLTILDHHYKTKSCLLKLSFHSIIYVRFTHVDDIQITSSKSIKIQSLIILLNKNCSLKDVRSFNYLEIEVKKIEIRSLYW